MARIRTIKPEIFSDSKTGTLSGDAFKLFLGLLSFSDDRGVIEFDLLEWKGRIFPYLEGGRDQIIPLFQEITSRGLATMFEYSESPRESSRALANPREPRRHFVCIQNFAKHQKVDHPGPSIIPGWKAGESLDAFAARVGGVRDVEPEASGSPETPPASRALASPRESSRALAPEGKGREGNRKEEGDIDPNGSHSSGDETPDLDAEDPDSDPEPGPKPPSGPRPKDLLAIWNDHRGDLPAAKGMSQTRKARASARLSEEPSLDVWADAVRRIAASPFCRGENDRGWRASFDWLLQPDVLLKTLEGKYDPRKRNGTRHPDTGFLIPTGGDDLEAKYASVPTIHMNTRAEADARAKGGA